LALAIGCGPGGGVKVSVKLLPPPPLSKAPPPTPIAPDSEYLAFDSAMLNGKLPMESEMPEATQLLGTQYKLAKATRYQIDNSYYEDLFTYCTFKGLEFEKYGDTLILRNIDFEKNPALSLSSARLTLNGTTTIQTLQKVFPKAFANELSGTDMDKTMAVSISAMGIALQDDWILYFDRRSNKLKSIYLWVDNDLNPPTPKRQ
jgi:hypothetical protein